MSELQATLINSGRGLYRWERENSLPHYHVLTFEEGDAVAIDPFKDRASGATTLWPIFGTFLEYETEDIARVFIGPKSNQECPVWFDEEPGEYYIHEGYLTPQ